MKKTMSLFLAMIIFILPSIAGLPAVAEASLKIVCTSFPCYDFARAIAGEVAEIQLLIKPGTEVHSYEPTPTDVLAVGECDLFLFIGGESDVWVDEILESFADEAPETLRFMDCVEGIEEAEGAHEHAEDGHVHEYDEHIWTSPANAQKMIEALREALCNYCPEYDELFSENARAYSEQIAEIDEEIRAVVDHAERRELIFADRFPFLYFVREYGLEYAAAYPGCSAESEPSAQTMVELIDRVVNDQIPVIYVLEFSSGRVAATISEETGAKILTMQSIQNVTRTDFENGETYVSLMRRNVDALREGLN